MTPPYRKYPASPGLSICTVARMEAVRTYEGRSPLRSVTESPGAAPMPWNESWTEYRRMFCASCAFRAEARRICPGRALAAPQQASFNPLVLGSSPRRPTNPTSYGSQRALTCENSRPVSGLMLAPPWNESFRWLNAQKEQSAQTTGMRSA
jgi:hypothetical protein